MANSHRTNSVTNFILKGQGKSNKLLFIPFPSTKLRTKTEEKNKKKAMLTKVTSSNQRLKAE